MSSLEDGAVLWTCLFIACWPLIVVKRHQCRPFRQARSHVAQGNLACHALTSVKLIFCTTRWAQSSSSGESQKCCCSHAAGKHIHRLGSRCSCPSSFLQQAQRRSAPAFKGMAAGSILPLVVQLSCSQVQQNSRGYEGIDLLLRVVDLPSHLTMLAAQQKQTHQASKPYRIVPNAYALRLAKNCACCLP